MCMHLTINLPDNLTERKTICLNGTWEILGADPAMSIDSLPDHFSNTIPVPGLWDLAEEPITEKAAWYKKAFFLEGKIPESVILKIGKAFWGKYIYLNGTHVCDHHPNFTPAYVDITPFLHTGSNVLLIKIGAMGTQDRALGHPVGYDKEKFEYIPGIYDDVSLFFANNPIVRYIQTSPQLKDSAVLVRLTLANNLPRDIMTKVSLEVHEHVGKSMVAEKETEICVPALGAKIVTEKITLSHPMLWSPENPFLYDITAKTQGDSLTERFGMRTFDFNPETKLPMLNGQPYYLRGNNITMYRFFEDPDRGTLPWNRDWAEKVLRSYKDLNMNSIRYCIGFPPELWYELADELGFLIDDEYPIWLEIQKVYTDSWRTSAEQLEIPYTADSLYWKDIEALDGKYPVWGDTLPPIEEMIIPELIDWINERANHPCVVIWDIQNETTTFLTEIMIKKVRESGVDLSNRPWDNGWAPPAAASDPIECHPYLFSDYRFKMIEMNQIDKDPALRSPYFYNYSRSSDLRLLPSNPRIINEYCWLWMNRDATPTALTKKLYETRLPGASPDGRRHFYAHTVGKLTEFWRSGRKAAGVLYFCGLTYCKKEGFTCDAFLPDIAHPAYDPLFRKRVADAMAPIGICIEDWAEVHTPGGKDFRVSMYNDQADDWEDIVRFSLYRENNELSCSEKSYMVEKFGRCEKTFSVSIPPEEGNYRLVASYTDASGEEISSIREFVSA